MELYCRLVDGSYEHFFASKLQVRMCGVAEKDIVKVKIEEVNEESTHYAYKNSKTGNFSFIYQTKSIVQMCSPDGFKGDIERGEGDIVAVRIKVVQ